MKKILYTLLLVCATLTTAQAQELKQFTLEDLNFGGKNYRNMIAQNRTLRWWGDRLVRIENDTCWTVDTPSGKEKLLFTRAQFNKWSGLCCF